MKGSVRVSGFDRLRHDRLAALDAREGVRLHVQPHRELARVVHLVRASRLGANIYL